MEVAAELFGQQFVATEKMPEDMEEKFEEVKRIMTKVLWGRRGIGFWFQYDEAGRLVHVLQRNYLFEVTTKITYNEHGERNEARVTFEPNLAIPLGGARIDENGTLVPNAEDGEKQRTFPAEIFEKARVYKYEYVGYDERGNWTERKRTMQIGDEAHTTVTRRRLTYF